MKHSKIIRVFALALMLTLICCVPAFAAGDVASAVESTWQDAAAQIKTVVDNVVFPALDMILAIAFFTKLGMAYFDYRKHGQFEWTGPVILFACLVFTLTAPLYIWGIIGLSKTHPSPQPSSSWTVVWILTSTGNGRRSMESPASTPRSYPNCWITPGSSRRRGPKWERCLYDRNSGNCESCGSRPDR